MTTRAGKPDTRADVELRKLLDRSPRTGFNMVAGAGSGKTTSLVKALAHGTAGRAGRIDHARAGGLRVIPGPPSRVLPSSGRTEPLNAGRTLAAALVDDMELMTRTSWRRPRALRSRQSGLMSDEDRGAHRASPGVGLDAPPQASEEQEVRQAAAVLLTGALLVVVFFFAYASHAPLVGAAIDAGIVALLLLVRVAGRKRRAALKAAPPVDISMYTHARQAWLRRHPDELVKLAAERAAKRPAQPS